MKLTNTERGLMVRAQRNPVVTAEGNQELRTVDNLERLGFLRVTRVSARGAEVRSAEARLTERGATALELDGGWQNHNGGKTR